MAGSEAISVLVAAPNLVANGLGRLIDEPSDLSMVGLATTAAASVRGARRWQPDVVVVTEGLPDGSGPAASASVRHARPTTRVVLLTEDDPTDAVEEEAQAAGCSAVLAASEPVEELLDTIRAVHRDEAPEPPDDGADRSEDGGRSPGHALTGRELQVLTLLAGGADTDAIATELFLSVNTVRNHVQHVLHKLGAHSRLEAVTHALREGIVTLS